jgi:uncharacterized protein with HEPN domain
MKRVFIDYLNDILEAIDDIASFTKDIEYETFVEDHLRRNAVIRSLEIIGEASKNIPLEIKLKYQDVPWERMAGMRDKLIHAYFGVDYEAVWIVAKEKIPEIRPVIKRIISNLQS